MKRFTCILLALTMVLTMTACGEKKTTEGSIKEGLCYEATGISPDSVAITVDGNEIPMDIYFYFFLDSTLYIEQLVSYYGMALDWQMQLTEEHTVETAVKEEARWNAVQLAMIEKMAEEYDVTLSKETEEELDSQRSSMIEQAGGEDKYREAIAQMGLREESYERILRAQYLQSGIQQLYLTEGSALYRTDDELAVYAEENGVMTADHILLGTLDDVTREPLDEETVAARKAKAEEVLADLRAYTGDDLAGYFAELGEQFSTDPGRATNPEGYTFGPGQMVAEFEAGAAALQPGEVSDIIETDYGYHIILRKELDKTLAAQLVRESYFALMMEEKMTAATVETNAALESFDVAAAYDAFLVAQGLSAEEETPGDENGGNAG